MMDPLDDRQIDKSIIKSVLGVAFVALSAYLVYFGLISGLPAGPPEAWGQFGDYLGGLVNPAVGVATVLLVARTLHATRKEAQDTREELVKQTSELRRQVDGFERQERLKAIENKLNGVLADWKAEMEAPVGNLPPLRSENPARMEHRDTETTYKFLSRVDAATDLNYGLMSGIDQPRAIALWKKRFEEALQLLDELCSYCHEHELISGDKKATDYYRRRIQKPLRKFNVLGIVEKKVFDALQV